MILRKKYKSTVISVTGNKHIKEKIENQDYAQVFNNRNYHLLVVADGLGSAKYSAFGAKIATQSVKKAVDIWIKYKNAKITALLKLIHSLWELEIAQNYEYRECATTCLFALTIYKGKTILAKLGDGIILYKNSENQIIMSDNEDDNFTNNTTGLGIAKSLKEWNIEEINTCKDSIVFKATDGVSEDIQKGKENDFVKYLFENLSNKNQQNRNKFLKNILENWTTPNNIDDKTVAISWTKNLKKI